MLHRLSESLIDSRWLPWRVRHFGGPWNTLVGVHLRRILLKRKIAITKRDTQADITVVIGVKNRGGYRLQNALKSIRLQDYDINLIKICIVDYGSTSGNAKDIETLCAEYNAYYVYVKNTGNWNRAHCLNIGIKRAKTRFVLTADVDIIFASNYISKAIRILENEPLSAIYSQCLDLPESTSNALQDIATGKHKWELLGLRETSSPRSNIIWTDGICCTYTSYFHEVRGYDEYFTGWGSEDVNLSHRFIFYGLRKKSVFEHSYYLHQYHAQYAGVNDKDINSVIERNINYSRQNKYIFANKEGWGDANHRHTQEIKEKR